MPSSSSSLTVLALLLATCLILLSTADQINVGASDSRGVSTSEDDLSTLHEKQRPEELDFLPNLIPKLTYGDATSQDTKSRMENAESDNGFPSKQWESSVGLQPEGGRAKTKEHRHVLVKRFNEFVGKRARDSAMQAWTRGTDGGLDLPFDIADGGLSFKGLQEDTSNMGVMRGQENNLDKAKSRFEWRNLGRPKKLSTLRLSGDRRLKHDDRVGEMLKERSPWMGSTDVPFGSGTRHATSSELDTSPLSHSPMGTKRYAEFVGKRSQPNYLRNGAEFPGFRPTVPASKRYAEFLGKRSIATERGALEATLEKDMLQEWLHHMLKQDPQKI